MFKHKLFKFVFVYSIPAGFMIWLRINNIITDEQTFFTPDPSSFYYLLQRTAETKK